MKHYGFTAEEIIGWLRVCRPGSVIGPQQHYLQQMQPIMWRLGDEMRAKQNKRSNRKQGSSGSNVNGVSYGVSNMTIRDSDLAAMSQGDHLRSKILKVVNHRWLVGATVPQYTNKYLSEICAMYSLKDY